MQWLYELVHLLKPRKRREEPQEPPEHLEERDLDRLFSRDSWEAVDYEHPSAEKLDKVALDVLLGPNPDSETRARYEEILRDSRVEAGKKFAVINGGPVGNFARTSRESR